MIAFELTEQETDMIEYLRDCGEGYAWYQITVRCEGGVWESVCTHSGPRQPSGLLMNYSHIPALHPRPHHRHAV